MCVCCCTCVLMFVHEKVMFEVSGDESESMSDQYIIFFNFSPLLSILYDSFYAGLSYYFQ